MRVAVNAMMLEVANGPFRTTWPAQSVEGTLPVGSVHVFEPLVSPVTTIPPGAELAYHEEAPPPPQSADDDPPRPPESPEPPPPETTGIPKVPVMRNELSWAVVLPAASPALLALAVSPGM